MTGEEIPAEPCPECGKTKHNPRTGYCWLSTGRKGYHCSHCCVGVNTFIKNT